jgi:hypothetical protein
MIDPGAPVRIIAGRHRGARGILVSIEKVPTPAGQVALLAVVRRPRAGDTVVFSHEIEREVTDAETDR